MTTARIKDMLKLTLTLEQVIAGVFATVCTLGTAMVWVDSTFERKSDAMETKVALVKMIDAQQVSIQSVQNQVGQIAVDVSYIRGRIEPKGGSK